MCNKHKLDNTGFSLKKNILFNPLCDTLIEIPNGLIEINHLISEIG